jgi:hypothetical protein
MPTRLPGTHRRRPRSGSQKSAVDRRARVMPIDGSRAFCSSPGFFGIASSDGPMPASRALDRSRNSYPEGRASCLTWRKPSRQAGGAHRDLLRAGRRELREAEDAPIGPKTGLQTNPNTQLLEAAAPRLLEMKSLAAGTQIRAKSSSPSSQTGARWASCA